MMPTDLQNCDITDFDFETPKISAGCMRAAPQVGSDPKMEPRLGAA